MVKVSIDCEEGEEAQMSETSHWILSELSDKTQKKAEEIINEKKLSAKHTLNQEEKKILERNLEIYELAMIDFWDKKEKRNDFSDLSKKCFDILQTFPIPQSDISKIKHVLKLVAYSYIGEKQEDTKKILREKKVWRIEIDENIPWNERLLKKTYLAVLYLMRKESWKDISNAVSLINELRDEQKKYEEKYLNSIELRLKRDAALELASFYHFAKSIEVLGKFILEGRPSSNRVIDEVSYHLKKGIKLCELSGNFEFSFILQLVLSMFEKMILDKKTISYTKIKGGM